MKNQYFGDINDYRKYGLLRSILSVGEFKLLVAWMLTPNDGSTDGKFTSYLENSDKWAKHDPVLFHELKEMLADDQDRCVGLIENTRLLHGADFFSIEVPDSAPGRREWFSQLSDRAGKSDFIFLDPDNGLEVKSRPYGRKSSSKFLYWQEVESLWAAGKSLLMYQHFIREKRVTYTQRMLEALKSVTPGSLVEAFSTSNVVFLMALQSEHQSLHAGILESVQNRWEGQIQSWG
jgi:hypothetical protein